MSIVFKIVDMKLKRVVAEYDDLSEAAERHLELSQRVEGNWGRNRYVIISKEIIDGRN